MMRIARRIVRPLGLASGLLAVLMVASGPAEAGSFAFGADRTSNITISSTANWTTILTINIPTSFTSTHGHACQAVASLDALNPGGDASTQDYIFTITLNNANPFTNASGVERRIELRDQSGTNDPGRWPVSTNSVFGLTAGVTSTIRLLGRVVAGPPLTVDDAHLSIICVG